MRIPYRPTVYTAALAATVVLAGCSGDDTSEPEGTDNANASAATDESSNADQATNKCVGESNGALTIGLDSSEKLPGGSTARMAVADMSEDPPIVSFKLGQSSVIEQKKATQLSVGDTFGVARAVYVVTRICADEATIDEF